MRRKIIIAGLIMVLTISYIYVHKSRSQSVKIKSRIGTGRTASGSESAGNKIKKLPSDIPGGYDLKNIGRPPLAAIVWRQSAKLMGLESKTVKYMSFSSPEELQRYFTDKLAGKYAIIRDDLTADNGMGWSGLFLEPETDELITIFSNSRRFDLPPGGRANPTIISVMKVKNIVEDK